MGGKKRGLKGNLVALPTLSGSLNFPGAVPTSDHNRKALNKWYKISTDFYKRLITGTSAAHSTAETHLVQEKS